MTELKNGFFLFALVANLLFFSVSSIVGYTFEGSDSSPIYKIYMAGVGVLVILLTGWDVLKKKIRTHTSFWYLLIGLPLFVVTSYYVQRGMHILSARLMNQYMLLMTCFSYTAICSGIYIAHQGIARLAKYIDVMMLIMTLSFFTAIIATIAGLANVGGAGYQTFSYMAGFTFCINICMILWGDRYERFKLFTSRPWHITAYLFLVVQLIACLISGGRGGFVLLAVGSGYMLYRSKKLHQWLTLGIFAILTTLAAGSFMDTALSQTLEKSTFRTFDYLHGDAEHMKKVSGRTGVYDHAWQVIQEDHFMGRGLFRSIQEGYPHNFFLEVMEQGGILFLLFWLVFLGCTLHEVNRQIRQENAYILLPLLFYPYIQLLFSGTYITCPLFWFVLSYTWTRKNIRDTHESIERPAAMG